MATPTTASVTPPQADTQKTLWANANETLIAPQLLLISEPETVETQSNNNNDEQASEAVELAESAAEKNSATLQAPKSPPRWPLRPGVMLHVNRDTKKNLAVNRMTLKPDAIDKKSNSNNTSIISETSGIIFTSSPLLSGTLGRSRALSFETAATLPLRANKTHTPASAPSPALEQTEPSISQTVIPVESTSNLMAEPPETNSIRNTSVKFERRVQQFLVNLFRRAKGARSDSTRDSQRSHVQLLSGMIFGRRQQNDSQFDNKHRLKGIRCSGSVTYKKTHLLNKTNATATDTTTATTTTTTSDTIATPCTNSLTLNNNKNSSYIINHIITQTAMTSSSQAPQVTATPLLPARLPPPVPPPPVKRLVQRSASCGHSKQSPACATYPVPCCSTTTPAMSTATTATVVAVQSAPSTPKQLGMRIASTGSQSAGNTPMRSILKNRSPPPTTPPRCKQKTMPVQTPNQLGVVQSKQPRH